MTIKLINPTYFGLSDEWQPCEVSNPKAEVCWAVSQFDAIQTPNEAGHSIKKTIDKRLFARQQKLAVRHLLHELISLKKIKHNHFTEIISSHDFLDDTQLPYRIHLSNEIVSFSHSGCYVACAVSKQPIGIDIECHDISPEVAHRFFNPNEVAWLETLAKNKYQSASRLLWMVKEARLKASNASDDSENLQLINQLKQNHRMVVLSLFEQKNLHSLIQVSSSDGFIDITNLHYQYAISIIKENLK